MKPHLTLPYMPSQAVSPAQLLAKLSSIKSANETSTHKLKQIKHVEQQISIFQDHSLSTMEGLHIKLQGLNNQVNELKKSFKKAENVGVLKFDKVQKILQKTLDQYEHDKKKGQQMIDKLVKSVEQQLQRTILQKSMRQSVLVEQYLKLNSRLESILISLGSMQSQLMSQYNRLRSELMNKFRNVEREILSEMEEIDRNGDELLKKLDKIQTQCECEINSINERKQNKRYQLHQMMQKMIEDAVENDDLQ